MQNLDTLQKVSRLDDLERRSAFIQWFLVALLVVVIAVPIVGVWWLSQVQTEVSSVNITDMQVVGESELCPGDTLQMAYNFRADGEGILDIDRTIWSVAPPPKTVIFSDSQRFVLVGKLDEQILEAWQVPDVYLSANLGQELPLTPGEYLRIVAVSSPSRASILTIASVPFTVTEGCEL